MTDSKLNATVDGYLVSGCLRCPLGNTPHCKVHKWTEELKLLRGLVLASELTEEVKWGVPCYTYWGNNVVVISAFNDHCVLSFFKGALLKDEYKLLEKPGENTQSARVIKFTNVEQIHKQESVLKAYINDAIENEKAGLKVEYKSHNELDYCIELQNALDDDPAFKAAFEALTPGRRRGYNLHFSGAKQSATRITRIEKCTSKIFEGKGMHD
ncbi:MAG: hypothetical protein ACI83I_002628 [Bacteroidia bacterium]|jgi:uncharacterized protein YdeI (YjbR/CyaY-like superfamily)